MDQSRESDATLSAFTYIRHLTVMLEVMLRTDLE